MSGFISPSIFAPGGQTPPGGNPFNFGGGGGALSNMMSVFGPSVMQAMGGQGFMPTQLIPTQSVYDQMKAQQFMQQQQLSMQHAAFGQRNSYAATIQGFSNIMGGGVTQAGAQQMASYGQKMMPFLAPLLGNNIIDQMAGVKGDPTMLAASIGRAMRVFNDPATGRMGYSGRSAGVAANEMYAQLYDGPNWMARTHGLSAGQVGSVYEGLANRGLIGTIGTKSPMERYKAVTNMGVNKEFFQRMARESLSERIANGESITKKEMNREAFRSNEVFEKIQDAVDGVSGDIKDFANNKYAKTLLSAADGQRAAKHISGLAGSLSAMKSIFGGMGVVGSSFQDLVGGIQALTQGGLSKLGAGQVEGLMRRAQSVAATTGIGMQGVLAMGAQGSALADQLGVDRTLAFQSTLGAIESGRAAGMRHSNPFWGKMNQEQVMLGFQRMRIQADASVVGNQSNALLNLDRSELIKGGTEAAAMAAALKMGDSEYTFGGKTRSINMTQGNYRAMMMRSGLGGGLINTALQDVTGNQELGLIYETGAAVQRSARGNAANYLGNLIGGEMQRGGAGAMMRGKGGAALQRAIAEAFIDMPESIRTGSAADREEYMREAAINAAPNKAAMVKFLDANPGMAFRIKAQASIAGRQQGNPLTGIGDNVGQFFGKETEGDATRRRQYRQLDTQMRQAMSQFGEGSSGPLAKLVTAIQGAKKGTSFTDIAKSVLGVDLNKFAKGNKRGGALQAAFEEYNDMMGDSDNFDPDTNVLTKKGIAKTKTLSQIIMGLGEGGKKGYEALNTLQLEGTFGDKDKEKLLNKLGIDDAMLRDIRDSAGLSDELNAIMPDATGKKGGKGEAAAKTIITGTLKLIGLDKVLLEAQKGEQNPANEANGP